MLHAHLLYDAHLVHFAPPLLTLRLSEKAPQTLPQKLQDLLKKNRNEAWTIAISEEIGHPTLHEKTQKILDERRQAILQTPLVKMVMETFPGTTLIESKDP